MKRIEAIIQPGKLDEIREALKGIAVERLTVSEVMGVGHQRVKMSYRGSEYEPLLPRLKLEVIVPTARVSQIVEVISGAAWTGKIGDGKVFISSVDDAVRIRNGDRGEDIL